MPTWLHMRIEQRIFLSWLIKLMALYANSKRISSVRIIKYDCIPNTADKLYLKWTLQIIDHLSPLSYIILLIALPRALQRHIVWPEKNRLLIIPGASAGDEDTEDELEYGGESRATTLPRGMQSAISAATNSLPRLPASGAPTSLTTTTSPSSASTSSPMHKAHSVYHFLPQHSGVKSARYRPPGFARNSNVGPSTIGPKRAVSAPGLQVSGSQSAASKRENSRSRRQQAMSLTSGKLFLSFFFF